MTVKNANRSLVMSLLPIMGAVFTAFLITGFSMTALPVHVHNTLGFGTFIVGLVAGAQFATALISRFWSGTQADKFGGKKAVIIGLILGIMAGLLFLLAVQFNASPNTSVAIIIAGRGLFGGAESFIVTGALSWGLAIGGPKNAGKVMAWIGTAMYVAIAAGAPIGTFIYSAYGFLSIALITSLISFVVLLWVSAQHFVVSPAQARPSITKVINAVAMPGIGLAFSSIGFAAISTFIVLLFSQHAWNLGWLAVTVFAVAFVLARVFLSGLADQVGGSKVAFLSALIEAIGLGLIWFAPSEVLALVGATITGFGYSLVYPGLGVEALHRSPAESRGLAMGAYTAFLDLALGIANPVLGLLATTLGIRGVFLSSAILVMCSSLVSLRLMISNRSST